MYIENPVIEDTQYVVKNAEHVKINIGAVADISKALYNYDIPVWDYDIHYADRDSPEKTAQYILILDSLNFCFWPSEWRVEWKGKTYHGYKALAASLTRAIEEGIPILDADYLENITVNELRYILRGEGEASMIEQRVNHLQEVGRVLNLKYNGLFKNLIESVNGSGVELALKIADEFSSFSDYADYKNRRVAILKRAQITVADLYGIFGGESYGFFEDMDRITAFADYKLPQVLRKFGVIEYSEELAEKIDNMEEIEAGSIEEIEIRAATVVSVEKIKEKLSEMGRYLKSYEIDWMLWEYSQQLPDWEIPHHRTLTHYY